MSNYITQQTPWIESTCEFASLYTLPDFDKVIGKDDTTQTLSSSSTSSSATSTSSTTSSKQQLKQLAPSLQHRPLNSNGIRPRFAQVLLAPSFQPPPPPLPLYVEQQATRQPLQIRMTISDGEHYVDVYLPSMDNMIHQNSSSNNIKATNNATNENDTNNNNNNNNTQNNDILFLEK